MTTIERHTDCPDVDTFLDLLRSWLASGEQTIGDSRFGGTSWVRVRIGDTPCHLNADTRRAGVKSLLELVGAERPDFSVVTNQRGTKINRVVIGTDKQPIEHLYLYTDQAQYAPRDL